MGRRPATHVFANFSAGGVPAGITEGVFAAHIERETGFPLSDMVDGCSAASAGTSIAVPLFAAHELNRNLPRFTAEETLDLFKENAQLWLERPVPYLRQHLRQTLRSLKIPFTRSAAAEALYLDEKLVEHTLDRYLGPLTLMDLRKTFMISAHNVSASPREEAVQMGKIIDYDGRERYTPSPKTRIADLMRGSMAVPGHFKTKFIEGVGNVSDYGHIYDAHIAFLDFKDTLPRDARTAFIEFGGPRQHGHHSAEQLDQCSLLAMILNAHLVRGTSNHSYSVGMKMVQRMIRDNGEIHDLTPIIDVRKFATRPSENILDASAKSMKCAEDFALTHIANNSEEMKRLCDFLAENHIERTKPVHHTGIVAVKKEKPGNILSWLIPKPRPRALPAPVAA